MNLVERLGRLQESLQRQCVFVASDTCQKAIEAVTEREELINALIECADYFDGCSDADFDGDTFVANKEMRLKMMVDELLAKIGSAK